MTNIQEKDNGYPDRHLDPHSELGKNSDMQKRRQILRMKGGVSDLIHTS